MSLDVCILQSAWDSLLPALLLRQRKGERALSSGHFGASSLFPEPPRFVLFGLEAGNWMVRSLYLWLRLQFCRQASGLRRSYM